jgi:alkylation response protein AidB-like acyl-CoA dehydrogenase
MDFSDTPPEAEFRHRAREWLTANAPRPEDMVREDEVGWAKRWQMRKFEANWACVGWPTEYGGQGASAIYQVIWDQEEARFVRPHDIFTIGQGIVAPTLIRWASRKQTECFLPKIASGEEIWCQLFSEPSGGSDIAALRTRAVRDRHEWVVNGQKVWTSGGQHSQFGVLVARTDPGVVKHQGLTYFFVDMRSPGIEVRPVRQMTGEARFNEVFFTDLRIPDRQRLGGVGEGWSVVLTTLMNERVAVGGAEFGFDFNVAYRLAKAMDGEDGPAIADRAVRAKLANWYVQEAGLKYIGYRTLTALSRGQTPGPENSIGKYVGGQKYQDMASFCLDLFETAGMVSDAQLGADAPVLARAFLVSPAMRIAGGTDEILLNVLAERVLGLPQEPRLDKGVPFNKVPTG